MSDTVNILIGGDICPGPLTERAFTDGRVGAIFSDLMPFFETADLRIVNIEAPLTDGNLGILKTGPCLKVSPQCVKGLLQLGVNVAGLGNNHILDYGTTGLMDTVRICKNNGVDVVGAGKDEIKAAEFIIREINGIRIAIAAFADREWSIADAETPGAAAFDPIDFVRLKRKHAGAFDYLIVLLHMGNEHYPLPSPSLRKICHFLIEEGGSLVVCQHSHCVGAREKYLNGEIFYGQGNLVFDRANSVPSTWLQGFLILASFSKSEAMQTQTIPFEMDSATGVLHQLRGKDEREMIENIERCSREVIDEDVLAGKWQLFCLGKKAEYFSYLIGLGRLGRRLERVLPVLSWWYRPAKRRLLLNCMRCQAHRDVLMSLLDK